MSSSHIPASNDAGIFSDAEEHPWGESPHKRPSSSASDTDATSSDDDVVDASVNNESVHMATTTPSKSKAQPFDERPTPNAAAVDTNNDKDKTKTKKQKKPKKPKSQFCFVLHFLCFVSGLFFGSSGPGASQPWLAGANTET